jgi:hypothetical protein
MHTNQYYHLLTFYLSFLHQNHLWQKSLSSRTANLKNFSEQTMRGVEKSVRNSKKLEHTQQNSLANQENILSQSEKVGNYCSS